MWRYTANKVIIQEEIRGEGRKRRKLGQNLCPRMSSLVSCALRNSANVAENFKIKDNVQNLTNLCSNKDSVRMWSFVHLSRNAETIISSILVRSETVLYSWVKLNQIANLYFCSSSLSIVKVWRHLSPKL